MVSRFLKSRWWDSHPHILVYKTSAFLGRATSANDSRCRKHERKDSNPVRWFWRPLTLPGARSRIFSAPDEIRTRNNLLDRQVPFPEGLKSIPKKGARRESNPYLPVHSRACRTATPQAPYRLIFQRKERDSNPQGLQSQAQPVSNRVPSPIGLSVRFWFLFGRIF